jgi:hypothetical protein
MPYLSSNSQTTIEKVALNSLKKMVLGLPLNVVTPLLEECEDDTHTSKMGIHDFSGTPEISKFNSRGQKTSHWVVIYIIGKLSKSRCRK